MKHPLEDFHHCPHCGRPTFEVHNAFSKRCTSCGFEFYPNAAAATAALILTERDEVVCVLRNNEPAKGTLDRPGGFVNPGESRIEGLKREVKEEIGIDIEDYRFIGSHPNVYPFSGHDVHTCDAFFLCRISTAAVLQAGDDAAEVLLIPRAELCPARFGLASIRRFLEDYLG